MSNSKSQQEEKTGLHPRNPHRFRYNFNSLTEIYPELADFLFLNSFQDQSIDFKDPAAVKALNKALLIQFYGVRFWDIPEGYLCPPIPGRADYIHYMADLLSDPDTGVIPKGKSVRILDIGVGANCIYPLIGHKEYGWSFVGSEVDHLAFRSARNIAEANSLSKSIEIRRQKSSINFFDGIIKPGEKFNLTICNPPFHASSKDAEEGTQRKWRNLGVKKGFDTLTNFGGQGTELWCEGGEEGFLVRMIYESTQYAESCNWFTSLVSKKATLPAAYHALKKAGAAEVQTLNMSQGQKVSRVLAWTFMRNESGIQ
jgi:23S rRNA (adenine1618-N6)-methyltransferase